MKILPTVWFVVRMADLLARVSEVELPLKFKSLISHNISSENMKMALLCWWLNIVLIKVLKPTLMELQNRIMQVLKLHRRITWFNEKFLFFRIYLGKALPTCCGLTER